VLLVELGDLLDHFLLLLLQLLFVLVFLLHELLNQLVHVLTHFFDSLFFSDDFESELACSALFVLELGGDLAELGFEVVLLV